MQSALQSPKGRLLLRATGAALGLVWLLYAASLVLKLDGGTVAWAQNLAYYGLLFAAGLVCAARALAVRAERVAWGALAIGLLLWAGADLYYSLALENLESPPYPSLADAGWLAIYPASYVSIVLLVRSRIGSVVGNLWLDGLIGALALAGVAAAMVFQPIADMGDGGTTAAIVTNLAYPVGDMLVLAFVVSAIALSGWRPTRMWLVLGAGLAASAVADSLYLYKIAVGSYVDGSFIDCLWPASALLMAWAAWQPAPARAAVARLEGWRVLAMPAALMGIALVTLMYDHYNPVADLALWLSGAALAIGIVRMAVLFREYLAMLAGSRHEAITDPLTGLRNRRGLLADLEDAVAYATSSDPVILVLFDLDGFKGYNDSFGHPAGDALLARLGGRLHDATESHGTAYRLGGDEFCVLLRVDSDVREPAVAAAVEALQESGEGFVVSTSYGEVAIPTEAEDTAEAMLLADRRMYAHKVGGRASAGRQSRDVLLSTLREREPDLHQHLEGVAQLAAALGRELGMSAEELDEVVRAAELHDIGKIAVPDAILRKPGPLDESEWAFMREHTIIGERILAAAPALRSVAILVRGSHERWDGTGYPDRLAGEEIPLGARVVCLCDAFHAMTSDRPYRAGLSLEEAIEELERCAGSQFDPVATAAFVGILRDQARSGELRAA